MLKPKSIVNKRVLIAPLDWGLGHTTRCIPIIQRLLDQNNTVFFAGTSTQQLLIKEYFGDQLTYTFLRGYEIHYKGGVLRALLFQLPKILIRIVKEHFWLQNFAKQNTIDIVISDNRFGLWNKKTESIYITHQLFIKAPFAKSLINKANHWFIKKYNQCWVPDEEGEINLSGELAHQSIAGIKPVFIGILSRFSSKKEIVQTQHYDILALVSGPDPLRSQWADELIYLLKQLPYKSCVILGNVATVYHYGSEKIEIHHHLSHQQLEDKFTHSKIIIARSGYTSVMELHALNKKAILVPTPKQSEQEYLATYLSTQYKKRYCTVKQSELTLEYLQRRLGGV